MHLIVLVEIHDAAFKFTGSYLEQSCSSVAFVFFLLSKRHSWCSMLELVNS